MPTYTVIVTVNVPGVGQRTFTTPGLVATTPEDAITQAKTQIIVQITGLTQTAP